MRALWTAFGKPGQKEPGKVATPYTIDGLKETLAKVSGDRAFANEFFTKYVEGRDLPDYERLLARAGLVVRKRAAGKAFAGQVDLQAGGSALRVGSQVPFDSPLYKAGLAQDDQLASLDGTALASTGAFEEALSRNKPGATVAIRYIRRDGEVVNTNVRLEEDPRVEIVPIEKIGGTLTDEQRRLRELWLSSPKR